MGDSTGPPVRSKISLNLYSASNLSVYEITEAYFRRKLPCKLAEDKIGIYHLLASQALNYISLQDFVRFGDNHRVKRYCKLGSNIISLLVYRNFDDIPAKVSLKFKNLNNLQLLQITTHALERSAVVVDARPSDTITFMLSPDESREYCIVHITSSFDVDIEEFVDC